MIYKYKINYKSIGGSSSTSSSTSLSLSTSRLSTLSLSTKNVLFACTTLHKDSTLSRYFDEINKLVRKDLGEDQLITYFVYKKSSSEPILVENIHFEKTLKTLNDNNYFITEYPININFVDFLKQNQNLKFDKIVLTQCNEIITIIKGDFLYNIKLENNIFQEIYDNLFYMNNSLKDNGIIINYHIGINMELSLFSFSNTLAFISIVNFPYVLFILILIDKFFVKTSIGIYRKKSNVDTIYIEEIIKQLIKHFDQTDDYKTVEEYKIFFINSLTKFSTNENNFFRMDDIFNRYFKKNFIDQLNIFKNKWKKILSPDEHPRSLNI